MRRGFSFLASSRVPGGVAGGGGVFFNGSRFLRWIEAARRVPPATASSRGFGAHLSTASPAPVRDGGIVGPRPTERRPAFRIRCGDRSSARNEGPRGERKDPTLDQPIRRRSSPLVLSEPLRPLHEPHPSGSTRFPNPVPRPAHFGRDAGVEVVAVVAAVAGTTESARYHRFGQVPLGGGRSPASGPAVVAAIEGAFEPFRFRPEQAARHPLRRSYWRSPGPRSSGRPRLWYAESRLSGPRG